MTLVKCSELARKTLALVTLVAALSGTAAAQSFDKEKYQPLLRLGAKIDTQISTGVTVRELASLTSDLSTELILLADVKKTPPEESFVDMMTEAADALRATVAIWQATIRREQRLEAEELCLNYGTSRIEWGESSKYMIVASDATDFIRAARKLYTGAFREGEAAARETRDRIERRRNAAK